MSEFSILKPKTRVSMFYSDWQKDLQEWLEDSLLDDIDTENLSDVDAILNEFLAWENEGNEEENINHNPYDPDYEDEFSSFFWGGGQESSGIIPVQEIENLEPAGFVVDERTED